MKYNKIYLLTMEDFYSVLEDNYSEEQIEKISNNFTDDEIQDTLSRKLSIDYTEEIIAVIDNCLLNNK